MNAAVHSFIQAFVLAQTAKNLPEIWETWDRKTPWRRAWQPTPVFLPGESQWTEEPGMLHKESDTTEQLSTHTYIHTHSLTGLVERIYWNGERVPNFETS